MRLKLRTVMMVVVGIILAGCMETKQEVILNPDGSGKVLYKLDFDDPCLAGFSRFTAGTKATMVDISKIIEHALD